MMKRLVGEVFERPAPESCKEIAALFHTMPKKSQFHKNYPSQAELDAFALLEEKMKNNPTAEEVLYYAEVCMCKYNRIVGTGDLDEQAREFYQKYLEMTGSEDAKYILDHFDAFCKECFRKASRRDYLEAMAAYRDGPLSTSRDPDSDEWKK